MKRAIRYALAVSLVVITTWMAYDNVLSDLAPIQDMAEKAACTVKKCDERHGMTRLSRTPIGQSFSYTWKDGTVNVSCHRAYYVVGERACSVD